MDQVEEQKVKKKVQIQESKSLNDAFRIRQDAWQVVSPFGHNVYDMRRTVLIQKLLYRYFRNFCAPEP